MRILQLFVKVFDVAWLKACHLYICRLFIMDMHVYFIEVCIGHVCGGVQFQQLPSLLFKDQSRDTDESKNCYCIYVWLDKLNFAVIFTLYLPLSCLFGLLYFYVYLALCIFAFTFSSISVNYGHSYSMPITNMLWRDISIDCTKQFWFESCSNKTVIITSLSICLSAYILIYSCNCKPDLYLPYHKLIVCRCCKEVNCYRSRDTVSWTVAQCTLLWLLICWLLSLVLWSAQLLPPVA